MIKMVMLPVVDVKLIYLPENYPYCRPMNKLPGTTVKTVSELSQSLI